MKPLCVKIHYRSKRVAKRARKSIPDGGALRPYRCLSCTGRPWHLGHLPAIVRAGILSRSDVYGARR